jgi:hypothetical protein
MENENEENKQEAVDNDSVERAKKLGPVVAGIGSSLFGGLLGDKVSRIEINVHVGDEITNYNNAPRPLVGGCA